MTSLLDIAPPDVATTEVPLPRVGKTLVLRGLDARDIATLMRRFPAFRLASVGRQVTEEELMDVGMDATPVIIAMGLGASDPETERLVLERLTIDEQAAALSAIMKLTNPDAPAPDAPFKGARRARGGASGRAQAGTSP